MKANKNIALILAVGSIAMCMLSSYYAIVMAIVAVLIACLVVKDDKVTSRTLQPVLYTSFVVMFRIAFDAIISIISTFAKLGSEVNYEFTNSLSKFSTVVDLIVTFVLIAFFVIAVICVAKDRPVPGVDGLANKIVGIKEEETDNKASKDDTTTTEEK